MLRRYVRHFGLPVAAALSVGNLVAQPIRGLRDPLDTDYVAAFSVAARMLRDGNRNIYCIACQHQVLHDVYHVIPVNFPIHFANPPLAAWVLQPLAGLAPRDGLAIFLAVTLAAIAAAAAALHYIDRRQHTPAGLLFLMCAVAIVPGSQTAALGQWDGILLVALTFALLQAPTRPLLSGLLLSVLLLKPQVVWLVPVGLTLISQWRVLFGFFSGGVVWLVTSITIVGADNLGQWVHQVLPIQESIAGITVGVPGMVAGTGIPVPITAATAAVVATGCVYAFWRARQQLRDVPAYAIGLGVIGSLVSAPHVLPHDLMLLAPPLMMLATRKPRFILGSILMLDGAYVADLLAPPTLRHTESIALAAVAVIALATAQQKGRLTATEPPNELDTAETAGRT